MNKKENITALLSEYQKGQSGSDSELWNTVYEQLRRIAKNHLSRESPGQTLQPTALIHEAFFRLNQNRDLEWKNRRHFFATASRIMRHILVDVAKSKRRKKRGSKGIRVEFDERIHTPVKGDPDLISLNDALEKLSKLDERLCRLVELRYFSGLSLEETADILEVSLATVKRDWSAAKLWLYRELKEKED